MVKFGIACLGAAVLAAALCLYLWVGGQFGLDLTRKLWGMELGGWNFIALISVIAFLLIGSAAIEIGSD